MSEQLIHSNVEPPTVRKSRRGLRGQKPPLKSKRYGPSVSDFSWRNGYVISRCSISQSIASYVLAISGNRTFLSDEIDGVARNDAGGPMFERFGQRGLGWVEIVSDEGLGDRGRCTYTDKDGDNIFTTYSGKGDAKGVERGNYEVVGGTGKFTGITGTGDYFQPNIPIKADDKAVRGL